MNEKRLSAKMSSKTNQYSLENERVNLVISLVKEGKTLEEIGKILSITRERARQIIEKIRRIHGDEVFAVDEKERPLSTKQVAELLNLPIYSVVILFKDGIIPFYCRGKNSARRVRKADAEAAKSNPVVQRMQKRETVCIVCRKTFVLEQTGWAKKICSLACKKSRDKALSSLRISKPPDESNLRTWKKVLWTKLQSRDLPKNETWISLAEARRRTGLSHMQLIWLRTRKIVKTRPHATRSWRQIKPVSTFASSEMEIVREVYADFLAKKPLRTDES